MRTMRNRTQVRPATTEEAAGLEMVSNWEDVHHERLWHYTDVTEEGEPEEDEEMGTGDSFPDVRHGRPDAQPEPERAGASEGSVEPSHQPLTVPEPEEERVKKE